MTVLVYINPNDTCPPLLLVYQVSTTGTNFQLVPPGLAFPVALLRLPGVSPPRPVILLMCFPKYNEYSKFGWRISRHGQSKLAGFLLRLVRQVHAEVKRLDLQLT